MTYYSLHNHDEYSNASCGFLDSSNKLVDMIEKAKSLGMRGIAITDHETISAHMAADIKYYKEDSDFKIIYGNEIYLARSDMNAKTYVSGDSFYHFILLALDKEGHDVIRELSNKAWNRSFMRSVVRRYNILEDFDIIKEHQGHVVGSSACIGGLLGQAFLNEDYDRIETLVAYMTDIFGVDNFFVELQPAASHQTDQRKFNKYMYDKYKDVYKFILTTDSHYLSKELFDVHKIFLNSNSSKEREVDAFYATTYLMAWEELSKYFKADGFSDKFIEECRLNTLAIGDRATKYTFKRDTTIPVVQWKDNEYLTVADPDWSSYEFISKYYTSPETADRHLLYKVFENYDSLIDSSVYSKDVILARIDIELKELWGISEKLHTPMSNYLITMQKIINIVWEDADAIVGPSRGSAAAWIVNYLLGIVQENPLDSPLYIHHWRFITAERWESLPKLRYWASKRA